MKHRLKTAPKSKRHRFLLPGVHLDSLTLTSYSPRLMQAEGRVRIGQVTWQVGTLLDRNRWTAELQSFLSGIPTAHLAWKQKIAAMNYSRKSTRDRRK